MGVHVVGHLQTNGLRNVGARGHGIAIAQKTSFVRGQVVENQRSVQRTARRDRTTSFIFVLADLHGLTYDPGCITEVACTRREGRRAGGEKR